MRFILAASLVLLQTGTTIKSGPQPGEAIPGPFHYMNINGTHAGSPHCLVCEYGLDPVVAVFARDSSIREETLANLLRKLDEAVGRRQALRLHAFAAFLSEDYAKEENQPAVLAALQTLAKDTDLKNLVVCVGDSAGPEKYQLNDKAEVTVILYRKRQVVNNWALAKGKLADNDVAAILAEIDKLAPSQAGSKKAGS